MSDRKVQLYEGGTYGGVFTRQGLTKVAYYARFQRFGMTFYSASSDTPDHAREWYRGLAEAAEVGKSAMFLHLYHLALAEEEEERRAPKKAETPKKETQSDSERARVLKSFAARLKSRLKDIKEDKQ